MREKLSLSLLLAGETHLEGRGLDLRESSSKQYESLSVVCVCHKESFQTVSKGENESH